MFLGGFKSAEQKVIDELYSEERRKQGENLDEEQAYPVQLSAMAFALTSIKVFKTITHFCMGKEENVQNFTTFHKLAVI